MLLYTIRGLLFGGLTGNRTPNAAVTGRNYHRLTTRPFCLVYRRGFAPRSPGLQPGAFTRLAYGTEFGVNNGDRTHDFSVTTRGFTTKLYPP